ncbi:hypothetical protein CSUI_011305, partial [Cystoisospora suis]
MGSKGSSIDSLSQGDGCLFDGNKTQKTQSDNRCVASGIARELRTEREGPRGEEKCPSSAHTEECTGGQHSSSSSSSSSFVIFTPAEDRLLGLGLARVGRRHFTFIRDHFLPSKTESHINRRFKALQRRWQAVKDPRNPLAAWRTSLTIPFSLEEDLLLLSHLSNVHHLFIFPPSSSSSHLHSNRLLSSKGDGEDPQHASLFGEETRHLEGRGASEKSERAFFNSMYSTPRMNLKIMTSSSLQNSWFPMRGSHHSQSGQPLHSNAGKGGSSTNSTSHSSSCDCTVEDWLVFIAKHDLHHRDVTSLQKRIRVLHRFSLRIASSSSSIPSSSSTSASSSSSSSLSRFLSSSKTTHAGERLQAFKKSQRKEEKGQQPTVVREGMACSSRLYSGELSSGVPQGGKESGGVLQGEEQNFQRLGGREEKEDVGEGERRRKEEERGLQNQGRHMIDAIEKGMREQERGREEEKALYSHQRDRRDEVVSFSTFSSNSSSNSSVVSSPPEKEQHTSVQTLSQQTCTREDSQGSLSSGLTTASSFSSSSSSSSPPPERLHAAGDHPLSHKGDTSPERRNQECDNRNGSIIIHEELPKETKASPPPLSRKLNPLLALLSPALMKWSSDETRALLNTRPHSTTSTRTRESPPHTESSLIIPKIHLSFLSSSPSASQAAEGATSSSFFLSSSSSSLTPPLPSFSSSSSSPASARGAALSEVSSMSLLSSSYSPAVAGGAAGLSPSPFLCSSRAGGMCSLSSLSAVSFAVDEKKKEDVSLNQKCPDIRPHPVMCLSVSEEEKKQQESSSCLSTGRGGAVQPSQAWPSLSRLSHEDILSRRRSIERDSLPLHEDKEKERKDMTRPLHNGGGGEEHSVSFLSGGRTSEGPLEYSRDDTSLSTEEQDMLTKKKKRKKSEGKNDEEGIPLEEEKDAFNTSSHRAAYRRQRATSSDDERRSSSSSASFIDVSQFVSCHANRDEGETEEPHAFTNLSLGDQPCYNERSLNEKHRQEISSSLLLVHRSVTPVQGLDSHLHIQKLDEEGDTHSLKASSQPLCSASHESIPSLHPSPSSSYQHDHRASHSTHSQVDFSSSQLESRLLRHPETGTNLDQSLLEKNQYENLLFLQRQEKNLLPSQLPYVGGVHDNMKKSLSPSLSLYPEREKSSYASIDLCQDPIHRPLHLPPHSHLSWNNSSSARLHEEKSSLVGREEDLYPSPLSFFVSEKKDEKASLSFSSGDLHANQKAIAVGVAGEDPIHQEKERREECCEKKRLSEEKTAFVDERREEEPGGEEEMFLMKQPREEKSKDGEQLRDMSHVAQIRNSHTTPSSSDRGRNEETIDRPTTQESDSPTSRHKSREIKGGEGGEREASLPEGKMKKNGTCSTTKGLHTKLQIRNLICAPFYQDVTSIAEALDEIPCDFFLDSINCGIPPA